MEIKFVKTHPDAILPRKTHPSPETGDACFDLFAIETISIKPRQSAIVGVGIKVGYITPGYWFRIESRSGNGFIKGLQPHPGVIDNPYRGDLGIKLFNLSDDTQIIEKGKGVAQFSIFKMYKCDVSWIENTLVIPTDRGEKGFGHSDKLR